MVLAIGIAPLAMLAAIDTRFSAAPFALGQLRKSFSKLAHVVSQFGQPFKAAARGGTTRKCEFR
jgi:hypothetical protein